MKFWLKGDHDQSIVEYSREIALDAKDVNAYLGRAAVHRDRGNYDDAIADYGMAIRHEPNNPGLYYIRAAAFEEKGAYDRAIADYSHAAVDADGTIGGLGLGPRAQP